MNSSSRMLDTWREKVLILVQKNKREHVKIIQSTPPSERLETNSRLILHVYIIKGHVAFFISFLVAKITIDAVFYRTYPLLYHKFGNMVILAHDTYIHFVAQETSIFRKLFFFSSKKVDIGDQSSIIKIYKLHALLIITTNSV